MTPADRAALRQAAEGALLPEARDDWYDARFFEGALCNGTQDADAAHIAAASPQAVLALLDRVEALEKALERAKPLVRLVTVGMAIRAGDEAIDAAGLNPWAINEGRATGDEPVPTWWMP